MQIIIGSFSFLATPQVQPVVISQIPVVLVKAGIYFEYKIPEGTFFDFQDGPTRNLTLTLLTASGQVMSAC